MLSTPATGTANEPEISTLTWSAGSGGMPASYAVQVSTSATFSSTVYSQSGVTSGTSVTTGSLSNLTTYYWEVSATNANGTSAWSGVWSFTTIITAPGVPVLSTPSTGATSEPIAATLTWSAGGGGTPASYAVQVSTSAAFSSTVYSQSGVTGGTSVTTGSLSNLTTYYWEVSATNANGTSAWSSVWSFTTVITAPGVPVLSTPSTGATSEPIAATLTWAAGSGGTPASYSVQVSTSATFSSTVYSQSGVTSGTSVTTGSLSNLTTYYWEVSATNANGTSAWSSIWSFTTVITAPGVPVLSTPSTGTANEPEMPTLTWSAGSGGTPASYAVQVSTSATFSSTVYSQSGVTSGTSVTTGSLSNLTTYYWEVSATNANGTSAWSSVWSFTTVITAPGVPVLSTPSTGTTNEPVAATLTWSVGSGGTPASYAVQVSTSATFSSTVYSQSGVTSGTSVTTGSLSNLTMYYWEVSATNANGTSAWSGVWSFTTIITAPGAPVLSTPSTGTANEPEISTLTWSAGSGGTPASYAVQVSTSATFSSTVYSQSGVTSGTSVTTGSLSNLTTYYWEVSATNANGTSAWSSVWSFTTIITAPGAPTLSTPANNAANQSVTPTLTWSAGSGGTPASYAVQVSTSATFSSTVYSQSGVTGGTSVTTGSLSNLTTYYWEVSATNANGTSAWSGVWSFTTIITAPGAPTLSTPSTGTTNEPEMPTLTWSAGSGGTPASYAVQVSTSATFSSTVYSQSGVTSGTSVTTGSLSNLTMYYWEVNATNANGTSAWSGIWSFTTIITEPGVPVLSTPSTGTSGQSVTPTLTWSAGSGGTPASYAVQVSTSATFSSTVYSQSGVTGGTSVTTGSLSNLTTYYWEVSATNANGTSAWSSVWSFTTIITAPGSPTLSTPSTGTANQSVTPTLTWSSGSGGTPASYAVQVSTSATFSSTVYSQSGVTGGTSVTTGSLSNLTTYYWEVSATNANGISAWSSVWSFTTIITAPGAPTLSTPANNAANQSVTPTLTWSAGGGGTPASYAVQVSTSATFSSTVYSQSGVTGGTSVTTSSLSNLTTYYWEVSATNANGTSAWSSVWSFTTIITAPGAPTLSTPSTGTTNEPEMPTLTWAAGSGGTPASYAVQVSTSATFSSTVYSQSGVTAGHR